MQSEVASHSNDAESCVRRYVGADTGRQQSFNVASISVDSCRLSFIPEHRSYSLQYTNRITQKLSVHCDHAAEWCVQSEMIKHSNGAKPCVQRYVGPDTGAQHAFIVAPRFV